MKLKTPRPSSADEAPWTSNMPTLEEKGRPAQTGYDISKQLRTPTRHTNLILSPKKAHVSSAGSKGAAPLEDGVVSPSTRMDDVRRWPHREDQRTPNAPTVALLEQSNAAAHDQTTEEGILWMFCCLLVLEKDDIAHHLYDTICLTLLGTDDPSCYIRASTVRLPILTGRTARSVSGHFPDPTGLTGTPHTHSSYMRRI